MTHSAEEPRLFSCSPQAICACGQKDILSAISVTLGDSLPPTQLHMVLRAMAMAT